MKVSEIKQLLENNFQDNDEIVDIAELHKVVEATPPKLSEVNVDAVIHTIATDLEDIFSTVASVSPAARQAIFSQRRSEFFMKLVGEFYGERGQNWVRANR